MYYKARSNPAVPPTTKTQATLLGFFYALKKPHYNGTQQAYQAMSAALHQQRPI
ncbi:hypothetical protein EDC56_3409 [Sinobacterium caligoides]|uniref:Uncharacterized protein n=1 Tax=Sinobacterium caligoides TaxID=933926 RepID=A0A3N2DH25_9GAMM|nr:hypothetical protein EDC56_3409 [Sinobacterium caligoides]